MAIRSLLRLAPLALAIHVPKNLGYGALAALVGGETMGIPLPGESALIVAGILANHGHLKIELVEDLRGAIPRAQAAHGQDRLAAHDAGSRLRSNVRPLPK